MLKKVPRLDGSFYSLLIANLLSNCAIFHTYHAPVHIFFTVSASFLLAYLEYFAGKIFPGKSRSVYYHTLTAIYTLLIVVEYFVLIVFHRNITEDLMFLIMDTNKGEIGDFFRAYTSLTSVLLFLLALAGVFGGLVWIGKGCDKIGGGSGFLSATVLALLGAGTYSYLGYSYLKMDDGMHGTQYTTFTRLLGGAARIYYRYSKIEDLRNVCRKAEATSESSDSSNVVVVIGESFSRYHSSLYGYRLRTNPLLERRRDEEGMVMVTDVITRADQTHEAMRSVFSTDSLGLGFGSCPLFPVLFRKAGYKTFLWDNQYLIGGGISFLADKELSEILYDCRNEESFPLDGPFIETLPDVTNLRKTLFIIHLEGQHFFYPDRYEKMPQMFTAADYDSRYAASERAVMADYDNATLYNDRVVDRLLEMFGSTETILLYFTDHGEEVYENGNGSVYGHTNVLKSPDLRYQIHIPFMIWMSPSYRERHPETCKKIEEVKDYPMITDDVSHLLLDLADIQTETFSPCRSVINPAYRVDRDRMILNSFNYDEWLRKSGLSSH